jgi:hypothetical protein
VQGESSLTADPAGVVSVLSIRERILPGLSVNNFLSSILDEEVIAFIIV